MPLCASRAPVSAPDGYGWHCTVAGGPDHDGSLAPVMMTGSTSRAATVGCAHAAGAAATRSAATMTAMVCRIPMGRVLRFAVRGRRANEDEGTRRAGDATI